MSKYKKQIILFLLIIELFSVYLTFSSFNNKDITKIKEVSKVDKEMFAMYVINETTGKYEEVTDSEYWPSGNYKLNTTKSSCVDTKGKSVSSDVLNYNGGKLTVSSNQTLFCYLYFDIKADITINVSTDGVAGVMPTTGGYKNTLSCNDATYSWNPIYQRIEFSGVSSDEVKCNLDYTKDTEIHTTLISEVESKAQTHENGYRYSGKQPDNWIWFNGEKWRIIGSIPTTLADGTETNLVKIIRSESIGGLSFDISGNKTWGSNTLYTLLNSYYYGKIDATENDLCIIGDSIYALCNYEEIGISNSSTDYYGKMIKEVYWNIGTSGILAKISDIYASEVATKTTSTSKVGLMNASDYGYATSEITYSSATWISLSSYEQNNWLYGQGQEWTMTPSTSSVVLGISVNGLGNSGNSSGIRSIRPVVYLDYMVYIVSGEGTESNPYTIGI